MNGTISAEDLLKPPSDEEVGKVLLRFAKDVHEHYGSGVAGLYLYGSRARAEHHPESDADLVVVLSKDFDFWREASVLSDLSYDYLADQGVCIDATPVAFLEWNDPSSHANPSLVRAMRRDCKAIGTKILNDLWAKVDRAASVIGTMLDFVAFTEKPLSK